MNRFKRKSPRNKGNSPDKIEVNQHVDPYQDSKSPFAPDYSKKPKASPLTSMFRKMTTPSSQRKTRTWSQSSMTPSSSEKKKERKKPARHRKEPPTPPPAPDTLPVQPKKQIAPTKPPTPLVAAEANQTVQQAVASGQIDEDARRQISLAVGALDQAGNEFFRKGEYDQAFARYERAMWLKRRTLESPRKDDSVLASMATSINNMTYLKQVRGQASTDETMASYLKSLQIKREILGPDHLSVGKTLNNIGSVFYLKHEHDAALTAYKDAYRILSKHLGEEDLDTVTVLSNMADVHAVAGNKEEALGTYRAAVQKRWKLLGASDPKVIRLMEQIARLETGNQPQSTEPGSITEEVLEDEHHDLFHDDINTLQDELSADMQYFDLMERQMAIDMVRDKTRIFREMRDISGRDEDKQEATEDDWSVSTPTRDGDALRTPKRSPDPPGKEAEFSPVRLDVRLPGTSRTSEVRKPARSLTSSQRQDALSSVKERLERIRASRPKVQAPTPPPPPPPRSPCLTPERIRTPLHYMEPTVSSAAKFSPARARLKSLEPKLSSAVG